MSQILLVNSETKTLKILTNLLKTEGYTIVSTQETAKARELLGAERFNLMICNVGKGSAPELELLKESRSKHPQTAVVVITESGDEETAAKATELGVFACIQKPLKVDRLLTSVQKAVDYADSEAAKTVNVNLQLETSYRFPGIVAESPAMKSVCDMISRIAGTDVTVLVTGELGVGKEIIARTIHGHSKRKDKQFVRVDCSDPNAESALFGVAGQKSALESAVGSTLFFSEINGLQLSVQEKLAKSLRERKIDIPGANKSVPLDARIIASTSKNLEQSAAQGSFNGDLYKFLRIIVIKIPPLRSRKQDIVPIARQELEKVGREEGRSAIMAPEVYPAFEQYAWPGNVDEIRRVLSAALKRAEDGRITVKHLPSEIVS